MPVLFQSKAGNVVQLDDPSAQCTTGNTLLGISSDAPGGGTIDWNSFRAVITRVTMSQQVNVQFLHTMGAMVYVYVFGDRIGSISLSGLSFFLCPCDNSPGGQDDVYKWYKVNRASKLRSPVRVTIGAAVIEGFVTGFTEDVVDPSLNLVQWGVTLTCLPDED